eukprot:CAMPEP_0170596110 /NCGR_PEP_ID=MMETSP0224-20130122/14929_1 /TAXON_ID=285029 /ORGANISM="Togula jolla, Strain CCCM 725" /LENGTH=257 /DNA_ID=CAMNT_0010920353 /DNA_START=83 /DNA_END=856 /DNA_ORIENTATION=-
MALLGLVATASASHPGTALLRSNRGGSFVTALEFKHSLRVCNAYPYKGALDVSRGSEKLTGDDALAYKECRDFHAHLKSGDKLEFTMGDASAGTFSVSDLPNNDAVLLLVIHRHDTLSTAVSFESHVFANLLNAQVAVIDTYKGKAKGTPRIMDAHSKKQVRSELLRYDSVVAVNPGLYRVALEGQNGNETASAQLVALNRESYIVLRVGVEAKEGQDFPEELVVFPQSDPSALPSGAVSSAPFALALLLALAGAWY